MARFMPDDWPVPALDRFNREYFTSGKLLVQECKTCGTLQHPPEELCYTCRGMDFGWRETNGNGTIYSFVGVYHPVAPALQKVVPYTVALVSLDELPKIRVLGNVLNRAPEAVEIGQRVRAVFEEIRDEGAGETILLPQWEVV
jgi:uncharacterized OB-fold protein